MQATLIKFSLQDLVAPHRIIYADAPNAVKMLGKPTSTAIYQPWSMVQIVELVVCLPLNLIPYVGTPAFVVITGSRLGKLSLYRIFHLRGLSAQDQKRELRGLAWDYSWFGIVAICLELIPVLSFFFLITTAAGSAIWAANLEIERRGATDDLTHPDESGMPSARTFPRYSDNLHDVP